MKKLSLWLLMLLLLSNTGLSKPVALPQDALFVKELKSLSGNWRPIFAQNNGFKATESDLKGMHWVRNANGHWLMQRGDKTVLRWEIKKIDATKKPKTIDIEITDGPYKGIVYLGIYDAEGDTSQICFALPDRPVRPTEFSAAEGTVRACTTFKRVNN